MSKEINETVIVHNVERLRLSANGNPRYLLNTSEGIFWTEADSACAYGLENRPEHGGLPLDVPVILRMTKARRVWGWEQI